MTFGILGERLIWENFILGSTSKTKPLIVHFLKTCTFCAADSDFHKNCSILVVSTHFNSFSTQKRYRTVKVDEVLLISPCCDVITDHSRHGMLNLVLTGTAWPHFNLFRRCVLCVNIEKYTSRPLRVQLVQYESEHSEHKIHGPVLI